MAPERIARGQRALHRAAEGDAVLELLGDRLGDELGVELGALDLEDVDLDRLAGELVQVAAQRVDLGARLADHDARARGVDVDRRPRRASLRIVMSERPACASLLSMWSRIVDVLEQVVGEVALVEPVRLPVVDVADAEALGMDLLSHALL